MKKIIKNIFAIFSLTTIFALTSCHDVIFEEVRKEVKLEKAQISGDINNIVRYTMNDKEYLFVAHGKISYKEAYLDIPHNWTDFSKPPFNSDYGYVNKVASDGNYLYAQITLVNKDSDEEELVSAGNKIYYTTDGKTWEPITITVESETYDTFASGSAFLFCTNTIKPEHRKAYLRYYDSNTGKYFVYELNGNSLNSIETTTQPSSITDETPLSSFDNTTTPTYASRNCVYFNGDYYFSSYRALTTNETTEKDATCMYYAIGDNVYWSTDGTFSSENKVDLSCSSIYSMAITKDYLYLGTDDGIEHVEFKKDDDGKYTFIPTSSTSTFTTNAASTLSSYYQVYNVLSVYPEKYELDNILYGTAIFTGSTSSTSATMKNVGLWAYFKGRASWNIE